MHKNIIESVQFLMLCAQKTLNYAATWTSSMIPPDTVAVIRKPQTISYQSQQLQQSELPKEQSPLIEQQEHKQNYNINDMCANISKPAPSNNDSKNKNTQNIYIIYIHS